MHSTLFHIPTRLWEWPLFGQGLLLALWAVAGGIALVVAWRRSGAREALLGLGSVSYTHLTLPTIYSV